MSVYNNLESIRKLSNSSLTSIIDVTNLNFKSLSEGTLQFLNNINYDETTNSVSLYKGSYDLIDISNKLSLKLDGIPTFTIDSLGRAEGQELLVKVSESKRRRFTDFTDWPDEGVPGEIIYTGVQNQKPEFGEDFIGYLDGRGWVSLTTLNNPVAGLPIIPEAGSPLVIPTVNPGTGLLWVGPPGYDNEYDPQNVTLYFSDDDGNIFDIITDPIWERIGNGAKYRLTDELVIGDSTNNGNLKYVDGNQQSGYVLTSDSQGYASWQPSSGGGSGTGALNAAHVEIVDFTQDVSETITHNLESDSIHVQLIDLDGSEIVDGHYDNYTTNTVDVTLSSDNNNVKVVILAAGGVEVTSLEQLTDVVLMSPILDGDSLIYDDSLGVWINAPVTASDGNGIYGGSGSLSSNTLVQLHDGASPATEFNLVFQTQLGEELLAIKPGFGVGVGTTSIDPLAKLHVVGDSAGSTVFKVDGTLGELFTITDNLTGVLFSVNNISGLPIFEVEDTDEVRIGSYLAPAGYTTNKIEIVSIGDTTVHTVDVSTYDMAVFEYVVQDGTNYRAGNITAVTDGASVQYMESTTADIGNTSDVTMSVTITSSPAELSLVATTVISTGWTVKTIVRTI